MSMLLQMLYIRQVYSFWYIIFLKYYYTERNVPSKSCRS